MSMLPAYSPLIRYWQINPEIVYLNHASFGACPLPVYEQQRNFMDEQEKEAVDFFVNHLPGHYAAAKQKLAETLGADPNDLVFVPNTTTGVNTILHALPSKAGDEWLTTSHAYGACALAMQHYAKQKNCQVNVAPIPFPLQTKQEVIDAIEKAITPKTTFAMIDHITSATGSIFPVEELIALLHRHNILVLIDGAHAPGMVDLNIAALGADFYVGNCHKWLFTPKGSALMHVQPQHQSWVTPLVISHFNDKAAGTAAHWSNQFLWDGTHDFSAFLSVKAGIEFGEVVLDGAWPAIRKHNRDLALQAGHYLCDLMHTTMPAPDDMIGFLVNVKVPDGEIPPGAKYNYTTHLKRILFEKYKIEVPVFYFPAAPQQWVRISTQVYNTMEQYEYLGECLKKEFNL